MKYLVIGILCSLSFCAWAGITIDPASRTFTKVGGAGTILTDGDGTWTASTDVSWISIKPRTSGEAGVSCVYVVSKNMTADTRTGVVTVGGNAHTVTQTGYDATISPQSVAIDKNGGEGDVSIAIDVGVSWSVSCDESWVSVSAASGSGNGSVHYAVSPYEGILPRSATLQVAGKIFVITQTGKDVELAPASAYVECDAGLVEVSLTALDTTKWNALPLDDWLFVADGNTGKGDSTLLIAYSANESFSDRIGTVKVGSVNLIIHQRGVEKVELSTSPNSVTADPGGAYGEVDVTATLDGPWSVRSLASWLTLANTDGVGDGKIEYVVSANKSLEPREGVIKVQPFVRTPDPDLYAGLVYWHDSTSCYYPLIGDTSIYGVVGWATEDNWETGEYFGRIQPWGSYYTNCYVKCGTGYHVACIASNAFLNADGYAIAIDVCLNAWNQINRILQIGSISLYLDAYNRLCVNDAVGDDLSRGVETNSVFTIAFSQSSDGTFLVYSGRRNAMLQKVLGGKLGLAFGDLPSLNFKNEVTFGYSKLPNKGFLVDARISDIRVWARALTNDELSFANKGMSVLMDKISAKITYPKHWYYLPLDGNLAHEMDGASPTILRHLSEHGETEWKLVGCSPCPNRFGVAGRALKCSFQDVSSYASYSDLRCYNWKGVSLFSHNCPNNKISGTAGRQINLCGYFPGWDTVSSTSARRSIGISFWFYVEDLPKQGQAILTVMSDGTGTNLDLSCLDGVAIGPQGLISGSTVLVTASDFVTKEWHMLSVASGRVYYDGEDVGACYNYSQFEYFDWNSTGYRAWRLGCFDGRIDDCYIAIEPTSEGVTTYAMRAADIRTLYEATKPDIRTIRVTQGMIEPGVSPSNLVATASAGNYAVKLTMGQGVAWTASSNADWITLKSPASGTGSSTISFDVAANPRAEKRTGTLTMAGLTISVMQEALVSEVENDTPFPPCEDGGYGFVTVTTEAGALWHAVSDASWLTIIDEGDHSGTDTIMWAVDPYTEVTQCRVGTITVADHKIYVTQRGYQLSVEPQCGSASSRGAVGQIDVTTDSETAVWSATSTVEWIHIQGTGKGGGLHGTIRYTLDDNETGVNRSGSILVAGAEYVITQSTRVKLETSVVGHGTILGGGEYDANSNVVLTAVADVGYVFSSWGGDAFGVTSNITVNTSTMKSITATFIPESAARQIVKDRGGTTEGLYTRDQIHALEVGNLLFDVDADTGKVRVGVKLMGTGDLNNPDWQPVALPKENVDIGSDGSIGLNVPTSGGAKFYRVVIPEQ